jgi:hypothetical protein
MASKAKALKQHDKKAAYGNQNVIPFGTLYSNERER